MSLSESEQVENQNAHLETQLSSAIPLPSNEVSNELHTSEDISPRTAPSPDVTFSSRDSSKTEPASEIVGIESAVVVQSVSESKNEIKTKRTVMPKGRIPISPRKNTQANQSASAIPVKVTRPQSRLSMKPSRTNSIRSNLKAPLTRNLPNKHTLEVQFINKNKRLQQYKRDLIEKQKPVMDLYQNLLEIKKQLAEFGKNVEIEEVKLVSTEEPNKPRDGSVGDNLSAEIIQNMKSSIEHIPKTLLEVCHNLVSRRDAIVEILESVSQADIDAGELTGKIETLKDEGVELKKSLDALLNDSEEKIGELVRNWYTLLDNRNNEASTAKVEEYEEQLKQKDNLIQDSKQFIQELQRKLDDKRNSHDRAISECEVIVKEYTEKIKKLEHDLESEKKVSLEHKSRSGTSANTIKNLKHRLTETENKLKEIEGKNTEVNKKLKQSQDQLKSKETSWGKEKEDLLKNVKDQEKLLQKLTADRNNFQTRLETTEETKKSEGEELSTKMEELQRELVDAREEMEKVLAEKDVATKKYEQLEEEFQRLGLENHKNMEMISSQIDWGKDTPTTEVQAELYSELLATKVALRECEDKLRSVEKENVRLTADREGMREKMSTLLMTPDLCKQEELASKYREMLQESEQKLNEKSVEVAKLNAEIKHLKIRQDALEEQNLNCPTDELKKMVAEGRSKLSEIMKKSMENEQKLACYEGTIEKQHKQMNEMENLLRVRDGLIGMIKAKKDELLMEKDSLTRYCKDVRNMLAETREDLRIKSEVIRDLQEKLDKKEKNCVIMEKKMRELEENLAYTNEKRFKLQDTIGSMEKELQSTKAHVNQMAELQSRYDLGMTHSKTSNSTMQIFSKQNPTFESLTFHQQSGEFNLEMPIREMDVIRRRLYKLSNFQFPTATAKNREMNRTQSLNVLHSAKSLYSLGNKTAYQKMIELEARRYEILQKQTDESYENLSYLLRLSMPPEENPVKDKTNDTLSDSDSNTVINNQKQQQRLTDTENEAHKSLKHKQFNLNPKLHFNKVYLSHLSETYKDLNDSLTIIKNTLTEVDEVENSQNS